MAGARVETICVATALLFALAGAAVPAAATGSAKAGSEKSAMCLACHGRDGLSRRPDVPHIAGQSEIYMRAQLRNFRSGARAHPEMSVIAKSLSDEDINDLVAWYSSIEIKVTLPD